MTIRSEQIMLRPLGDKPDNADPQKDLDQVAVHTTLVPTNQTQISDLRNSEITPNMREAISKVALKHPIAKLDYFNLIDLRKRFSASTKGFRDSQTPQATRSSHNTIPRRAFLQRATVAVSIVTATVSGFLSIKVPSARAEDEPRVPAIQANTAEKVTEKDIEKAVSKGIEYLKSEARKLLKANNRRGRDTELSSPSSPSEAAFLAASLAKAGVKPTDSIFRQLIDFAENYLPFENTTKREYNLTYGVSCLLIAYEAAYTKPNEKFDIDSVPSKAQRNLSYSISRCTEWLIKNQDISGGWGYPSNWDAGAPDLSNTQFAAMGLRSALSLEQKIPSLTYKKMADYALTLQADVGDEIDLINENDTQQTTNTGAATTGKKVTVRGWRYMPIRSARSSQSSTAAGIFIVATALEGLISNSRTAESSTSSLPSSLEAEYRTKLEDSIYSGLGWLQLYFRVDKNLGEENNQWHLYSLASTERAMTMVGRSYIGAVDWSNEIKSVLLKQQNSNGSWDKQVGVEDWAATHHSEIYQSCFALWCLCSSRTPSKQILSVTTGSRETASADK
ncbi:MAG: hypothetical protein R3A13_03905 [Bdellovibrionota bacterium]